MTDLNVIQTRGLRHAYGDIQALRGVDLDVPRGAFFALLGPNGAGKSTLVSILSTLLHPQAGDAQVAGYDVRRHPGRVRRELGLVFQEPSLDERLTVVENLDFHGHLYGLRARERRKRIWEVLELVELTEWANATVRVLSRGMKRRLEIGRAVMHTPALLVLDEPTVGLDVQSRHRIWAYLQALRERTGVSILLTTHQIEEAENADLVAIIDRGEVLRLGAPADLRAMHGDAIVTLRGVSPELKVQLEHLNPGRLESTGDTIRLRAADPRRVFAELAGTTLDARFISVQSPSLEDVFLDLTGRQLREDRADVQTRRGA